MRRRFPLAAAAAAFFLLVLLPLAAAAAAASGGKSPPTSTTAAKAKAPAPAPPTQRHGADVQGRVQGVRLPGDQIPRRALLLPVRRRRRRDGVLPHRRRRQGLHAELQEPHRRRQASLLLFHAVPVYYTLRGLKSSNGPMNTLATDGSSRNYNFTVQNVGDQVSIRTEASDAVAKVKSTVYDKDPVAIYAVDTVLEPVELFEPVEAPAPAPAPVADAPKASKRGARHRPKHVANAPGPAVDDDAAADDDQRKNAKKNKAPGGRCPRWLAAVAVARCCLGLGGDALEWWWRQVLGCACVGGCCAQQQHPTPTAKTKMARAAVFLAVLLLAAVVVAPPLAAVARDVAADDMEGRSLSADAPADAPAPGPDSASSPSDAPSSSSD
ncbi:hypothetical protein HU200_012285 [Digitaria exilis]|uniref:FAS1 domain-containing protein n=1 Tax=Digitaria exilis TaxID=1010633 RepID=A0A835FEF4_9POAL|nr:hypothetical protein HU200_012285 [Digitaria exilis]